MPHCLIASLTIVVLIGVSVARNAVWYDELSLYSDVAQKSPAKVRPIYTLGVTYKKAGRNSDAQAYFRRTLLLDQNYERAYEQLAYLYYEQGDIEKAIYGLESAIKLKPSDRNHYNLGFILQQTGDLERAIAQYAKAISMNPLHADANLNLANSYLQLGMISEALLTYRNALKANPTDDRLRDTLRSIFGKGVVRD